MRKERERKKRATLNQRDRERAVRTSSSASNVIRVRFLNFICVLVVYALKNSHWLFIFVTYSWMTGIAANSASPRLDHNREW